MGKFDLIAKKIVEEKKANFIAFLIVLVGLTIFMIMYNSPLIVGHDFTHHWGRLEGLIQAIKDGTFPWYINYNGMNGTGYFVKAFYCDLSLLPFALIGVFTNITVSYYSILITYTLLCGVTTYYCVLRIYRNPSIAFIASILYTFCTYRLVDLYARSALAESITFTFLPIVFLGLYEVIKGDYKKWYILAIGYSLIIYSHLLTSVMLIIPIFIFLGIAYKQWTKEPIRILYLAIASVVTIILTSYYVFPMIEQMQSNTFYYETNGAILEKGLHQTLKIRMILSGFIQGTMDKDHFINFKIGALIAFSLFSRLFITNKSSKVKKADILFIVSLVILFMISNKFPWKVFPFSLFNVMQFSWRLFIFPSLFLAIAGATYLSELLINHRKIIYLYTLLLIFTSVVIHIERHNSVYDYLHELPLQKVEHTYSSAEYLPSAIPSIDFLIGLNNSSIYEKKLPCTVTNYRLDKGIIHFDINNSQNNVITLPIVYYKGYEAEINGTKIELKQSPLGLIELPINESGKVSVYYAGTTIQKVSTLVSLLAIISLCIFIYLDRNKRKNSNI